MLAVSSACSRQRQTQRAQKGLLLRQRTTLSRRSRIMEHLVASAGSLEVKRFICCRVSLYVWGMQDSEDWHVRRIASFLFGLRKEESMPKTTRRKFVTMTVLASGAVVAILLFVCASAGLTQEGVT